MQTNALKPQTTVTSTLCAKTLQNPSSASARLVTKEMASTVKVGQPDLSLPPIIHRLAHTQFHFAALVNTSHPVKIRGILSITTTLRQTYLRV